MRRNAIRWSFVAAVCVWASSASAFVPSGFRWRLPVSYEINTQSSQELGRATTLQVIEASYTNWIEPACSGFQAELRGETNGSWRSGDGVNTLLWIYDPNQRPRELGGRSTIGVTLSVFQGNNAIDGDILFNGIDHRWTTNARNQGQVDAVSIITHEIGHQLGLNHSPFQSATMYAAYLGGNGAASLDNDDIEGVCSLYPSGQEPDCRNDQECPDGQRCLGGSCVDGAAGTGAIGDPCNGQNLMCDAGLFCVGTSANDAFCTRQCQGGCPEGWSCQRVQIGGQLADICLPGDQEPGGGGAFGDPCNSGAECATGVCISDGERAFCSQGCSGPNDCPPGADCYRTRGGGGACVPREEPPPEPEPEPEPLPVDMFTYPMTPDVGNVSQRDAGSGAGGGIEGRADAGDTPPIILLESDAPTEGCQCDSGSSPARSMWLGVILLWGVRRYAAAVSRHNGTS